MQGDHEIYEHDTDSARPDSVAVQGLRTSDHSEGAGHPAPEPPDAQPGSVGGEAVEPAKVSEASCWRDGLDLFQNHICYPTMNGRVVDFRDGPRNNRKTRVGVVSDPIRGTSVWHYAKCSCPAGFRWGDPCAHKAAAFWLLRITGNLPIGFPEF